MSLSEVKTHCPVGQSESDSPETCYVRKRAPDCYRWRHWNRIKASWQAIFLWLWRDCCWGRLCELPGSRLKTGLLFWKMCKGNSFGQGHSTVGYFSRLVYVWNFALRESASLLSGHLPNRRFCKLSVSLGFRWEVPVIYGGTSAKGIWIPYFSSDRASSAKLGNETAGDIFSARIAACEIDTKNPWSENDFNSSWSYYLSDLISAFFRTKWLVIRFSSRPCNISVLFHQKFYLPEIRHGALHVISGFWKGNYVHWFRISPAQAIRGTLDAIPLVRRSSNLSRGNFCITKFLTTLKALVPLRK